MTVPVSDECETARRGQRSRVVGCPHPLLPEDLAVASHRGELTQLVRGLRMEVIDPRHGPCSTASLDLPDLAECAFLARQAQRDVERLRLRVVCHCPPALETGR